MGELERCGRAQEQSAENNGVMDFLKFVQKINNYKSCCHSLAILHPLPKCSVVKKKKTETL